MGSVKRRNRGENRERERGADGKCGTEDKRGEARIGQREGATGGPGGSTFSQAPSIFLTR
jgi:hypothetical protein